MNFITTRHSPTSMLHNLISVDRHLIGKLYYLAEQMSILILCRRLSIWFNSFVPIACMLKCDKVVALPGIKRTRKCTEYPAIIFIIEYSSDRHFVEGIYYIVS